MISLRQVSRNHPGLVKAWLKAGAGNVFLACTAFAIVEPIYFLMLGLFRGGPTFEPGWIFPALILILFGWALAVSIIPGLIGTVFLGGLSILDAERGVQDSRRMLLWGALVGAGAGGLITYIIVYLMVNQAHPATISVQIPRIIWVVFLATITGGYTGKEVAGITKQSLGATEQ